MSANKILVIGAGIAGPAVCYWLKRFGFSPVLIEKSPVLRKGGQALDIRGVVLDLVKKMGLYEQIDRMRTRVELGRYVDVEGNTLHEERGERVGFRQDGEIEIIRGHLVEILMSAIDGVPFHLNRVVSHLEQNEEGVKVRFKDGTSESFDLVIGADGIHSATRRMVFHPEEYELIHLGSYLSLFSLPNYLNLSHTEVVCEVDQKMATMTSDRDPKKAQASFMFRSQQVLKNIRDEDEQKQFLRDTYQNFGWEVPNMLEWMAKSEDFYFDSISQVKMKSWTKGRVALLGDAGYCASPFSGQGNNLALVGAYILAGELKKAGGNHTQAFSRYNELLHPFVEANQRFGRWASESFLVQEEVSKEVAEKRAEHILKEIQIVSNAISLPEYE